MNRPYMTTDYKDFSRLIGCEVEILKGWKDFVCYPAKVEIIAEYPNTVLLELTFIHSEWGVEISPRTYKKLIPKSAMAIGDILLRDKETRIFLTGEEITRYNRHAEPLPPSDLCIWE